MKSNILTVILAIVALIANAQGFKNPNDAVNAPTTTTDDIKIGDFGSCTTGSPPSIDEADLTITGNQTIILPRTGRSFKIDALNDDCSTENILKIIGNTETTNHHIGFLFNNTRYAPSVQYNLTNYATNDEASFAIYVENTASIYNLNPDLFVGQSIRNPTSTTRFLGIGTSDYFDNADSRYLGFHYLAPETDGAVLWSMGGQSWKVTSTAYDGQPTAVQRYLFTLENNFVGIGTENPFPGSVVPSQNPGFIFKMNRYAQFHFEDLDRANQFSLYNDNYASGNKAMVALSHYLDGGNYVRQFCIGCNNSGSENYNPTQRFELRVRGNTTTNGFAMYDGGTLTSGGADVTGWVLTASDATGNAEWAPVSGNGDDDWTMDAGNNTLTLGSSYTTVLPNTALTNGGCGAITGGNDLGGANAGETWANIYVGEVHTSYITMSSDKRFKSDIQPILGALDKINKLKGYYYNYDLEAYPYKLFPKGRQIGFLAQDLETVVPEVVSTDEKGYKSVAYQNMVALLAMGINEQQEIIEAQDSELEKLTDLVTNQNETIADLNTRLSELEVIIKGLVDNTEEHAPTVSETGSGISSLSQNMPNPTNGNTIIKFAIGSSFSNASIILFQVNGEILKEYHINGTGAGQVELDTNHFGKGIYSYSLIVDGKTIDTKSMVIQ